jgi:plastocyanin
MKIFGAAAVGSLCLLAMAVVAEFAVSAQVVSRDGNITIMDNCLPSDPGWTPTGGCAAGPNVGDVSFAEFGQLLSSPLITGLVGHPSWRNDPSHLVAPRNGRVRVTNRGGRAHTLTEVENFGGGSVADFNIAMTRAPECPPAPPQIEDALAPGQSKTLTELAPGLHKYQCCFHPWMRATIRVD